MNLQSALENYTSTILGSITALAPVAIIGLVLILILYGALARR